MGLPVVPGYGATQSPVRVERLEMDKYDRLVLKRHLRVSVTQHEQALEKLTAGTDYHEIVKSALEEAKQVLERLEQQDAVAREP